MSTKKVRPLSKKVSAQVHVLQRFLSLCNEQPDKPGFTLDNAAQWPPLKEVPRNTLNHAVKRFTLLGIMSSPGLDADGKRLYRIKNVEWAIAYIQRDKDKPWIPLTPTPETTQFIDYDKHRPHFDVQLTQEWFARVKDKAESSNNQFTLRTKAFTLSVNGSSLLGQFFIRPYWREESKHMLGQDFYDYLHGIETKGGLNGDFALPVDLKGKRLFIGGRPAQWSGSHYMNQLDIRTSEKDKNIKKGLEGLIDQADFNVRILDNQDAILDTLQRQSEVQSKIAETLQKVIKQLSPEKEQSYQAPAVSGGDYSYR